MPHNEFGQPVGRSVDFAGAAPQAPVTLEGARCRLEPLREQHAGGLFAAIQPLGPQHWTYLGWEPPPTAEAMATLVHQVRSSPGWVPFAICTPDGAPRGMASYLRADPAAGSIEVGGIVYGEGLVRTAAATEAMLLLARHAFEDLGYRRYEWKCDALNAPSRRAALRLGFSYEGTFRNALVTKGRNRDTAWFAIIADEWPGVRERWEQWLAPANFDETGRQRRPMSTGAPDQRQQAARTDETPPASLPVA